MKTTISFCEFCDAFRDANRDSQYSYKGKKALFEYLEQYGEDTGEEVELDIIALCCEYTEYENFEELKEAYPDIEDMEELRNNTTVLEVEDSSCFIIQDF